MRASDQVNATIQKIFDKQIGSSSHDDIVLWLYGKIKNGDPSVISGELGLFNLEDSEREWEDAYKTTTYYRKNKKITSLVPGLELPLGMRSGGYSSQSRVIGFADLSVEIQSTYESSESTSFISSEGVKENKTKNNGTISESEMCLVEVKTSINVGETIRQIRYYQQATGTCKWFVCAPIFPHVQILKDQGIGFIEYKPGAPN